MKPPRAYTRGLLRRRIKYLRIVFRTFLFDSILGAEIRVNGDDDNNNLIKVKLEMSPAPAPEGLEYVLTRTNGNIKVWGTGSKGSPILDSNDEQVIDISSSPSFVWVENPSGGSAFLELLARETGETTPICSDTIKFYPFTSVVIAIGGENQNPDDPPPTGAGIYTIGRYFYLRGYDVHMYAWSGEGNAESETDNAIDYRGISNVGIFGYSWGSDATYNLSDHLSDRGDCGTAFHIKFTSYVDAINYPLNLALTELPPDSLYHPNYYQIGVYDEMDPYFDYGLNGGYIEGAENHNLDEGGQTVTHQTIDDWPTVVDGIIDRLENTINR